MENEKSLPADPFVPHEDQEPIPKLTDPFPEIKPTIPTTKPKKVFTRKDIRRSITASVHLPRLYPDYDPWGFEMRLKLTGEAEERRQEYLSLSQTEQTVKMQEQALDEVCDLLVSLPTGFGDLKNDGVSPGSSYRTYVQTCEDPSMKTLLYTITEGANNVYWRTVMPLEFRQSV